MKVFVKVSYGDVSVHAIDTYEQCQRLYNDIQDEIYEMNIVLANASAARLAQSLANARPEFRVAFVLNELTILLDRFGIDTYESFEYGTGFYEVQ